MTIACSLASMGVLPSFADSVWAPCPAWRSPGASLPSVSVVERVVLPPDRGPAEHAVAYAPHPGVLAPLRVDPELEAAALRC